MGADSELLCHCELQHHMIWGPPFLQEYMGCTRRKQAREEAVLPDQQRGQLSWPVL